MLVGQASLVSIKFRGLMSGFGKDFLGHPLDDQRTHSMLI